MTIAVDMGRKATKAKTNKITQKVQNKVTYHLLTSLSIVRKQPIIELYLEFENVRKFYNLRALSHQEPHYKNLCYVNGENSMS